MKNTELIVSSESKAIKLAKEIIRSKARVKRLPYSNIVRTSGRCACGETSAIEVEAEVKGAWSDVTVAICSNKDCQTH